MPVVALGGLVVAIMAILLAQAGGSLSRAFASVLPKIHFAFFTINLPKWFLSIELPIVDWAINHLSKYFDDLNAWFVQHIMTVEHFFGATVSSVVHLGDQVAHIVTTVVPNAIRAAEASAGEAASDLFHTAETGIRALGRRVDGIVTHTIPDAISTAEHYTDTQIGDLHRLLTGAIADARTAVEGDLRAAKTDLTRSIASLTDTVARDFTAAKDAAQADATAALTTARGLVDDARTYAADIAHADATAVETALQKAIDTTNATVTRLTGTVGRDLTAAEQYANQQVATGVGTVTRELTAAKTALSAAIETASSTAATDLAAAKATLGTAITSVSSTAHTEFQNALTTARHDASTALSSADAAIGGALDNIYQDVTGKALAWNGDLTQVSGMVGTAITAAIAGVAARVATLEECSVGVCEHSPNNFGSLLKTALGLTELAGAGAFLTEIIEQPATAEQQAAGIFTGAISTGTKLFNDLLAL